VKKTPVAALDALCRRWLPQNRNEQRCRRARATRPNALGGNGFFAAIISTLIETANLNDVAGVLAVPVRARRSKTVIPVGSLITSRASGYTHPKAVRASAQARKQTHAEVGNHGGVSSPLGAELMNVGPDFQAFVTRSTHLPSLPERGSWLVLFGFLRARFHGAVPLVVRMRILPGGDRLRLRG
jgi:hypothetical protein